jgi:dTDP-4-dehydrorhamnose 3,5-epimerase
MKGVELTPLKVIKGEKGNVMHALKSTDQSFHGFGESYFSTVNFQEIKGWKKHTQMTSNLFVPNGAVRFVFFDDRVSSDSNGEFFEVTLSLENYQRLTVQPGIWMAFQGIGQEVNLVMNISSIPHDPQEGIIDAWETSPIQYNFNLE